MDGCRDRKDGKSRETNGQSLKNRQETRDEGQMDRAERSQEETSQAVCLLQPSVPRRRGATSGGGGTDRL